MTGGTRLRRVTSNDPRFGGMTVNERLSSAGLVEAWDAAVAKRDRQLGIDLLGRVDLASQAAAIVDAVLADPAKYGYGFSSGR